MRIDLHLHSPDSRSFKLPSGTNPALTNHREQLAERFADQLAAQKIEVAALTDYNGVREPWYGLIRAAAAERGVVVLPGAELSLAAAGGRGLHVGVVFPDGSNPDDLNRFIHGLDRDAATPLYAARKEHRDLVVKESVERALRELRERFGALIIAVHAHSDKGLFKVYRPKEQARFITNVELDAIEGLTEGDRQRLIECGVDEELVRRIASIECSDAHSIEEIGTKTRSDGALRATCLKISAPDDIHAIRLALRDAQVKTCVGVPPAPAHSWFRSVEVEGAGFLGGLAVALSRELTTYIGGRGVGKSSLLEVIRYALDLQPYHEDARHDGAVRHALGSGGKVVLRFERALPSEGAWRRYRLERVLGEPTRVFDDESAVPINLPPRSLFEDGELPIFFGQKEIYAVTQDGAKRRRLLDEIIGRKAQERTGEVARLTGELRRNAANLRDLERELGVADQLRDRLKEVEHELLLFEQLGITEKLRTSTQLAEDEERLNEMIAEFERVKQVWRGLQAQVTGPLDRAAQHAQEAQSANKRIVERGAAVLNRLKADLTALVERGAKLIARAQEEVQETKEVWHGERRPLDEDMRRVKQELEREGKRDVNLDRPEELTRDQTKLKGRLDHLATLETRKQELLGERERLLADLEKARHDVYVLRRDQATEISDRLGGRVRVGVGYKEQLDEFVEALVALLQGSGVRKEVLEGMCRGKRVLNVDGPKIAAGIRRGAAELAAAFAVSDTWATRICDWFWKDPEKLRELELMVPEDTVSVHLRVGDDGELRPLDRLSGGQQATAILLLLLAQTERPLFVDQPEEDLDNRFIYDDVVQILRDQKGVRQVVMATHNANIPVIGDAELIVALEANADKAQAKVQGGIDQGDVREAVKQIMEGGEAAFRRRAEKYGWRQ